MDILIIAVVVILGLCPVAYWLSVTLSREHPRKQVDTGADTVNYDDM